MQTWKKVRADVHMHRLLLAFSGTNAFVVRYPEESVHAERAEEMAHQSMQE